MRALVVLNPVAGAGRTSKLEACSTLARQVLEPLGYRTEVVVTARPRDGHSQSARAVADGVELLVAWGGDGTVNEVASAVAFSSSTLAIVPAGSGNGLARDLGVPLDPAGALQVAGSGRDRRIDAGQLGDALFFNVAGIGLDGVIAARLATPRARRGLAGYVQAVCLEWPRYRPRRYLLRGDGVEYEGTAWFVALANSRQYGNGAQIAPAARLDDGRLDIVVVEARPRWRLALEVPAFFRGTLDQRPGILMRTASELTIQADGPMAFHVDGEPFRAEAELRLRTHPGAILVKSS